MVDFKETREDAPEAERARRMAVLAQADGRELARLMSGLGLDPVFSMVRGPETGLVTLRGRIGGGGSPFNFGEATVTRATVRLEDGGVGHAWMLGRDHAKARLAAIVDALASDPAARGWYHPPASIMCNWRAAPAGLPPRARSGIRAVSHPSPTRRSACAPDIGSAIA